MLQRRLRQPPPHIRRLQFAEGLVREGLAFERFPLKRLPFQRPRSRPGRLGQRPGRQGSRHPRPRPLLVSSRLLQRAQQEPRLGQSSCHGTNGLQVGYAVPSSTLRSGPGFQWVCSTPSPHRPALHHHNHGCRCSLARFNTETLTLGSRCPRRLSQTQQPPLEGPPGHHGRARPGPEEAM